MVAFVINGDVENSKQNTEHVNQVKSFAEMSRIKKKARKKSELKKTQERQASYDVPYLQIPQITRSILPGSGVLV